MKKMPDSQENQPSPEPDEVTDAVQVEAEIAELKNKLLRLHADFDNYRKRMGRARAESADECRTDMFGRLLPIYDNLYRALDHAQQTPEILAFLSGFEMIRQQFAEFFTQMGVEEIQARPGTPFDPNVHEASGMVAAQDPSQEGTIASELEKGYTYKGNLLRPARVLVFARR